VFYSGVVHTFPYSGRSVARQQLLATSLRLDNRAPLGVGHFYVPGLFLAKSGFGGLNNMAIWSGAETLIAERRTLALEEAKYVLES
jgi:hypothetical protein